MLQYCQIEEILGKRTAGQFTSHISHDCHDGIDRHEDYSAENDQAEAEAVPDHERKELEEAVERIRRTRDMTDN
jgi:cell division protease FtsH